MGIGNSKFSQFCTVQLKQLNLNERTKHNSNAKEFYLQKMHMKRFCYHQHVGVFSPQPANTTSAPLTSEGRDIHNQNDLPKQNHALVKYSTNTMTGCIKLVTELSKFVGSLEFFHT